MHMAEVRATGAVLSGAPMSRTGLIPAVAKRHARRWLVVGHFDFGLTPRTRAIEALRTPSDVADAEQARTIWDGCEER